MNNLKLYFSLISGEIYYIGEDEIRNLDSAQIPLTKKPNSSCKKCYGRLYIYHDQRGKYYTPCPSCFRKCVDWNVLKSDNIDINTPVTTKEVEFNEQINKLLPGKV
jgi:hypothetical protein